MRRTHREYPQSYYGILAILTTGPQTGYDIRKVLEDPEMFYWKESYGNIYPMLRSLEQDGLVEKTESYVKTKKRIIYELNPVGEKTLLEWLTQPAGLNRFRVEILMKLRFGSITGTSNLIKLLDDYRKASLQELEETIELKKRIQDEGDTLENDLRFITASFFSHLKESMLLWCDESIEILRRRPESEDPETLEELSGETTVVQMPSRDLPPME